MKILLGAIVHQRFTLGPWMRHFREAAKVLNGNQLSWHFISDRPPADTIHEKLHIPAESFTCIYDNGPHYVRKFDPAAKARLGYLRNLLRERALHEEVDVLISVDTDICATPEALTAMVEASATHPWVSALVRNDLTDRERYWNIGQLFRQDGHELLRHTQPVNGGGEADYVGAICLYRRDFLERFRFRPHHLGEDIGLGFSAFDAGVKGWYVPVECDHWMDEALYRAHWRDCGLCQTCVPTM